MDISSRWSSVMPSGSDTSVGSFPGIHHMGESPFRSSLRPPTWLEERLWKIEYRVLGNFFSAVFKVRKPKFCMRRPTWLEKRLWGPKGPKVFFRRTCSIVRATHVLEGGAAAKNGPNDLTRADSQDSKLAAFQLPIVRLWTKNYETQDLRSWGVRVLNFAH